MAAKTELYATGLNAWRQLRFKRSAGSRQSEPEDLHVFTRVLAHLADDFVDVESFISYTLGDLLAGYLLPFIPPC
jgi:hypothetical protein